jgi:hypothetical protein
LDKSTSNTRSSGSTQADKHKKETIPVKTLLIEVFSIVLGVLLALGVNQWRENYSNQKQAKTALQNISNEIRSNSESLKLIHENNLATIKKMEEDQSDQTDTEAKFIPGLQLRETAWETFLSTGISSYVDYETVLLLSQTYSFQEIYKQTGTLLTEAALNMAGYAAATGREVENIHFQKQFFDYLEMMVTVEEEILKSYDMSLEHLTKD